MCIWLARRGAPKRVIKEVMINDYYPEIATLDYDDLVENYLDSVSLADLMK